MFSLRSRNNSAANVSNRLAKLPPDPDDLASLKRFRDYNAEVAEIVMDLIRIAAPGARMEAATAAQQAAGAEEARQAHEALAANPAMAERIAPLAPAPGPSGLAQAHDAINRLAGLPRAPASPIAIVVACARVLRLCTGIDMRLSRAIAAAHTTAELAGLNHPYRQTVLGHLQAAARESDEAAEDLSNLLDIVVTEELGRDPEQNPADLIQALARRHNLPDNPEAYPNGWQPTRPPRPLRSRNDWVPKDPNHPFNQLVDVLMAKEAAAKPPDLN